MSNLFKFSLIVFVMLWCGLIVAQDAVQIAPRNIKTDTYLMNPDAECTGSGEIIYDDGSFENGYSANPAVVTLARFVQLVTPTAYPWQFNTFCAAFTRGATSPTNFTFDIIFYTNDGTGGAPGTVVYTIPGLTATNVPVYPAFAFYDYDVSASPALVAGSYFIGIEFVPTSPAPHYSSADESVTTPLQIGYWWNNNANVWATIQSAFANYRALGYRTLGSSGPPCPVTAPTNPSPADGTIDVPASGNTLMWTNATGTTQVEVWFGEAGNLAQVYDGSATESFSLASLEPLDYVTDYGWRVICKNDTCGTQGPVWTFTTMQDPLLQTLFCDDFESGAGSWTIINNGGTCDWAIYNPPYPNSYTLPPTSSGGVLSADIDECGGTSGTTLNSTAMITASLDATNYQTVWIEFDNDWNVIDAQDEAHVEVSNDGGTTWVGVWDQIGVDIRNTHEMVDITAQVALSNFMVRFRSVQPGWDWWWTVDNVCVYATDAIPVELTSFAATADFGVVELQWITATETNNHGFEVQRSNGNEFEKIAFIDGHGTTTESQVYTYSDRSVGVGVYSYRLRQIDFDGTYEYSNVVEVDVPAPSKFALEQNYPNPFNPSTKINFQLKVDSKVSLKVFDVLGQEVATLVNSNLVAGAHNVNFDASKLNSGVYLYRIEATGVDGSSFVDVKKMILTK